MRCWSGPVIYNWRSRPRPESAGRPFPEAKPSDGYVDAVEWSRMLERVIADTVAETERFPIIVRPLVRQGIRSKTGKSIQEWQQVAGQLVALASEAAVSTAGQRALQQHLQGIRPPLEKLSVYYVDAAAQMARMTKDQAALEEAARVAAERKDVIQNLLLALDRGE